MYAVTDIESTGLNSWRNEILTISTILADKNFNEVDRFTGKIKPEHENQWSEGAEKIHKISLETARTFDNSSDVFNSYINWLDSYKTDFAFVCHALPFKSNIDLFDRNFLFATFWKLDRRIDYYRLFPEEKMESTIIRKQKDAQELWGIKNQKLDTWMDKLGIEKTLHHDSEFDAFVCLEILKYQKTYQGEKIGR